MKAPIQNGSLVNYVVCLICKAKIEVDTRLLVGETLDCPNCEAQLEVAELDPVVIEPRARVDNEFDD